MLKIYVAKKLLNLALIFILLIVLIEFKVDYFFFFLIFSPVDY